MTNPATVTEKPSVSDRTPMSEPCRPLPAIRRRMPRNNARCVAGLSSMSGPPSMTPHPGGASDRPRLFYSRRRHRLRPNTAPHGGTEANATGHTAWMSLERASSVTPLRGREWLAFADPVDRGSRRARRERRPRRRGSSQPARPLGRRWSATTPDPPLTRPRSLVPRTSCWRRSLRSRHPPRRHCRRAVTSRSGAGRPPAAAGV